MKFFDLQPTHENILTSFENDLLGRNKELFYFVDLINSADSSCSIALDARWGEGKTFFIKHAKLVLDACNDHISQLGDDEKERVLTVWKKVKGRKSLELQPHVSVYYDAWLNDNDEDPILSLVYTILQTICVDFAFDKGRKCVEIAGGIADAVTGRSIKNLLKEIKGEDPFESLRKTKSLESQIAEFLDSLLLEKGNRLVIFVDELDRCRPTFAVQVLERIKHYFSNERITFVFSVNISELQHTIEKCYGSKFDACRYLDRFFDIRLRLPPADMSKFYNNIGLTDGSWIYESVCKEVVEVNHMSLREVAKFYRMARTAAYTVTHDKRVSGVHGGNLDIDFCLFCVVPVMIGLKVSNQTKYDAFVNGEDSSPLHEVFKQGDIALSVCNDLLARNETYEPIVMPSDMISVSLRDKLDEAYEALFVHRYTTNAYEKTVGKIRFREASKRTACSVVSMLSDYADYDI